MKKSIGVLLIAALTLSLIPAATFAATDETVIVRYNQDDTTIGAGWSTNGKGTLEITNHPIAPNGQAVRMDPLKYELYHGRNISQAYYGQITVEFDLYQTSADRNGYFRIRRFNLAGGSMAFDKFLAQLATDGSIQVDGVNSGWYHRANELYSFRVEIDTAAQTFETYLTKGMVSSSAQGEFILKENLLLGSGNLVSNFAGVAVLQFGCASSTEYSDKFVYVDNILVTAKKVTALISQVVGGIVPADVTDFDINLNHFIDTSTIGGFSVIRNGVPMDPASFTVNFSHTVAETTFSKGMSVSVEEPFAPGDEVSFSFGTTKDTHGRTLEDLVLTFMVQDLSDADATIKGILGFEDLVINHETETIAGIVGGYPSGPIMQGIVLAHKDAKAALLDADGNDVTAAKTALYEGDRIKITSANNQEVKIYTFKEKPAIFEYNFNNASTNYNDAIHSGNRNSTNFSKLFPADGGWATMYVAASKDTSHITAGSVGVKGDLSAKLVFNNHVNDTTGTQQQAIWKDFQITRGNNYVISAEVKPTTLDVIVTLSLRGGKFNTGDFLPGPFSIVPGGEIQVYGNSVGYAQAGNWYRIQAVIDTTQNILKTYINGKFVAQATIPQNILDKWTDSDYLAMQISQTAPAQSTVTSITYFDNLSVRELYSIDSAPSSDFYMLTSDKYKIDHLAGEIYVDKDIDANQLLSDLGGYPQAVEKAIYTSDELHELTGVLDLTESPKLVLKDGEKVVTYYVRPAEQFFVNGEAATALGAGTNTFIMNRKSGTMFAALYDMAKGKVLKEVKMVDLSVNNQASFTLDNVHNLKLKIMLFDDGVSLRPLQETIIITQ